MEGRGGENVLVRRIVCKVPHAVHLDNREAVVVLGSGRVAHTHSEVLLLEIWGRGEPKAAQDRLSFFR